MIDQARVSAIAERVEKYAELSNKLHAFWLADQVPDLLDAMITQQQENARLTAEIAELWEAFNIERHQGHCLRRGSHALRRQSNADRCLCDEMGQPYPRIAHTGENVIGGRCCCSRRARSASQVGWWKAMAGAVSPTTLGGPSRREAG